MNEEYRCRKCQKFYCFNCYLIDIHIKNDISNLITSFKICKIHNKELNNYCVNYGQIICIYCLKKEQENNSHKGHKISYILNIMPSKKEINTLKERIKLKSKIYKEIINSIDKWKEI